MLNKQQINQIEKIIGYIFADKNLLSQAFTRSSYHYEHLEEPDNEKLELLGDSVLSLVVIIELYEKYKKDSMTGLILDKNEGELSALKSALTNKNYLALQMSKLNLSNFLQVSVGDKQQGINNGISVMEDLFESIVGAVFLDTGKDIYKTACVVKKLLNMEEYLKENDASRISYKNDVQEWCQKRRYELPSYENIMQADTHISYCFIRELGISAMGEGHNNKEAENNAAKNILKILQSFASPVIDNSITITDNSVNALQEFCQARKLPFPVYEELSDEVNADNSHTFTIACCFGDNYVEGTGKSKKEAKKNAACNMILCLEN